MNKYVIIQNKLVNSQTGKVVPEDEPVFVLRAQDKYATTILHAYSMMTVDRDHFYMVQKEIERFHEWREQNQNKIKEPDTQLRLTNI